MKHKHIIAFLLMLCLTSLFAGEYRWLKKTNCWKGSGIIRLAPVQIYGSKIRLHYSVPKKSPMKLYMTSMSSGQEVRVFNYKRHVSMKNSSGVYKTTPYTYISLYIIGEGSWEITMDQYVDRVGEWDFRQSKRNKSIDKFESIGEWQGTQSMTYEFDVPAAPWHMDFHQTGKGQLRVTVKNEHDIILLQQTTSSAWGSFSGWGLNSGKMAASVEILDGSDDCSWHLSAAMCSDAKAAPLPAIKEKKPKKAKNIKISEPEQNKSPEEITSSEGETSTEKIELIPEEDASEGNEPAKDVEISDEEIITDEQPILDLSGLEGELPIIEAPQEIKED